MQEEVAVNSSVIDKNTPQATGFGIFLIKINSVGILKLMTRSDQIEFYCTLAIW